jgi:hypothetical protein
VSSYAATTTLCGMPEHIVIFSTSKFNYFQVRFMVRTGENQNRTLGSVPLRFGSRFAELAEPNLEFSSGFGQSLKEPDRTGPRQH